MIALSNLIVLGVITLIRLAALRVLFLRPSVRLYVCLSVYPFHNTGD